MATITKVTITTTSIYIFLSDNSMKPLPYTQSPVCFLYPAMMKQRELFDIQDKGRAVV